MKGLTLGCVNVMNGKRLVKEKITQRKRKREEKENGHVANSSSVMKTIVTVKLRKLECIQRANNAYNSFFFLRKWPLHK